MKKRIGLVALAMAIVLSFAFAMVACKPAGESVDYSGAYTLSKVEALGQTLDGETLASTFPPNDYFIEIKDSVNINFTLEGESISTTYTLDADGKTLKVKDGSETLDFTLDTGTKTISYKEPSSGATMYFTKG